MTEPTATTAITEPTETMSDIDKDEMIMTLTKKNCLLESKLTNLESKFEVAQEQQQKTANQLMMRELELIDMSSKAYPMAIDTNSNEFKHILSEKLYCFSNVLSHTRLIFCPFRIVTAESNNYSLKMLDTQRGIAIGNAKKADEAFDTGNVSFFCSVLFPSPSNSLPTPANETCIQANREKIASIIIYKARKAELKEKKEVRPTHTHTHARAHTHTHTYTQTHRRRVSSATRSWSFK